MHGAALWLYCGLGDTVLVPRCRSRLLIELLVEFMFELFDPVAGSAAALSSWMSADKILFVFFNLAPEF
ncbi:hypothetical protein AMQ84_15430 [Paenibacillus riograndensis]|uniref:Uncharacterized protein n=1 Tax=Paenibacillus riograndensis TaxID=483937 RepID=A0A132TYR9_9BACL|nr:hypothetical protein AMQ84_15430 [Paenibacillus riograndensis]